MESAEHRDTVLAELKRALEKDRQRLTVNGFTQLGLVEMTRKRTRESLAHILCEQCPTCAGRGELKTPRTVCYNILREIMRESKQFNPREFRILASQAVIDMFLDEESQNLAQLSSQDAALRMDVSEAFSSKKSRTVSMRSAQKWTRNGQIGCFADLPFR